VALLNPDRRARAAYEERLRRTIEGTEAPAERERETV
jgi:hypothetical protein